MVFLAKVYCINRTYARTLSNSYSFAPLAHRAHATLRRPTLREALRVSAKRTLRVRPLGVRLRLRSRLGRESRHSRCLTAARLGGSFFIILPKP